MKSYLLFPVGQGDLNNAIFDSPYSFLRQSLAERDIDLQTYDRGDLARAEKVLFFNHQPRSYAACLAAGLQPPQLVLFLLEPQVVLPQQYDPRVWELYGTIFTFLDNLVDNKKVFEMYYPQGQALFDSVPQWNERKFLTLINANKYSYVENELYSRRRRAIRYFEDQPDFDLYGYGWNDNGALNLGVAGQAFRQCQPFRFLADSISGWHKSPSYRGSITDKYETLKKYKFCLAFENEEKTKGYITEKIFDCLLSGTIPIYLGADNITDYIPADCFIDLRKFSGFPALEKYLRSITEQEYRQYQQSGQRFLRSSGFAPWLPANAFNRMVAHL